MWRRDAAAASARQNTAHTYTHGHEITFPSINVKKTTTKPASRTNAHKHTHTHISGCFPTPAVIICKWQWREFYSNRAIRRTVRMRGWKLRKVRGICAVYQDRFINLKYTPRFSVQPLANINYKSELSRGPDSNILIYLHPP